MYMYIFYININFWEYSVFLNFIFLLLKKKFCLNVEESIEFLLLFA